MDTFKPGDQAMMAVDVVDVYHNDEGTDYVIECPNGIELVAAPGHLSRAMEPGLAITFGDGAFDAALLLSVSVFKTYTLRVNDESVVLIDVDAANLTVQTFVEGASQGDGIDRLIPWTDVETIHVY